MSFKIHLFFFSGSQQNSDSRGCNHKSSVYLCLQQCFLMDFMCSHKNGTTFITLLNRIDECERAEKDNWCHCFTSETAKRSLPRVCVVWAQLLGWVIEVTTAFPKGPFVIPYAIEEDTLNSRCTSANKCFKWIFFFVHRYNKLNRLTKRMYARLWKCRKSTWAIMTSQL